MIWWAVAIALAAIVAGLWYWQIVITEGAYLGQWVVTLLYDRYAHKYNRVKEFNPQEEYHFLGLPLLHTLGADFDGVILDVATGTGRLPRAMTALPQFRGQVVGADHSRRMLAEALRTLPDTPLLVADALHLPFAAGSVGAATCLEALEFLPDPTAGLREMARVLAPGGTLLATNRIGWETKFMPGKTFSSVALTQILAELGFENIAITPWLDIYDQVWAVKKSSE